MLPTIDIPTLLTFLGTVAGGDFIKAEVNRALSAGKYITDEWMDPHYVAKPFSYYID